MTNITPNNFNGFPNSNSYIERGANDQANNQGRFRGLKRFVNISATPPAEPAHGITPLDTQMAYGLITPAGGLGSNAHGITPLDTQMTYGLVPTEGLSNPTSLLASSLNNGIRSILDFLGVEQNKVK